MKIFFILIFSLMIYTSFFINSSSESNDIPGWIKKNAVQYVAPKNLNDDNAEKILKNLMNQKFVFNSNLTISNENIIPSWVKTILIWWTENKIPDKELVQNIQYLINNEILIINYEDISFDEFIVSITGEQLVRRGTTQTIVTHVTYGVSPVDGAKVTLTIEDFDENIIKEFNGYTDEHGDFIFSWEIPKKFNNLKTLLAYISVTDNLSSNTSLFKFQIYCLPGESGCQIDGNR